MIFTRITQTIKVSSTECPSKKDITEAEIINDQSTSSKNVLRRFIHTQNEQTQVYFKLIFKYSLEWGKLRVIVIGHARTANTLSDTFHSLVY